MHGLTSKEWARFESRVAWLTEHQRSMTSPAIAIDALKATRAEAGQMRWMEENQLDHLIEIVRLRRRQRRERLHRKRAKELRRRGDRNQLGAASQASPQEGGG